MDKEDDLMLLPPGFRFHPTDEEIITNYLTEKVMNSRFAAKAIGEVDLNRCEPWDLPKKAKMGEKEWFFFVQRDRKYPTGMRTNRATESGYWKATGKDKEIFKGKGNLVGMKKTLVFYKGRAPKGEKTNWVMHEYRLDGKFSYHSFPKAAKDEWVVSKIFHKSTGIRRAPIPEFARNDSFVDHLINSPPLPGLLEHTPENSSFKNGTDQEEYGNFYMNGVQMLQDQKGFYAPNFNYTDFNKNQQAGSSTSVPNPIFYPQISHQIVNFSYEASPNLSYQNQERSVLVPGYNSQPVVRCKAEQFSSNNSMVSISQDTGLSTDVGGPEISSVISNPGNGGDRSFDDLRAAHLNADSSFSVSDLDFFWD